MAKRRNLKKKKPCEIKLMPGSFVSVQDLAASVDVSIILIVKNPILTIKTEIIRTRTTLLIQPQLQISLS